MNNQSLILAIETSCDDTSLALIKNGKLLDMVAHTSMKEHEKYGGIIPEIAARNHETYIDKLCMQLLKNNHVNIYDITHIAYTAKPGLPGSLHVGKVFAYGLANLLQIKLLPIDHMMGHAFSFAIDKPSIIKFPLLSLVVSGGNTILYKFTSLTKYKILNQTTDEAAGDTLDKIGRACKYKYPGGVNIDLKYNSKKTIELINHLPPSTNFSFSGIKAHCLNLLNKKTKPDIVANSAMKWIMDDLIMKLNYYSTKENIKNVAIGGGVSCNSLFRTLLQQQKELNSYITEKKYTGDNAAMIGFYASLMI